MELTGISAGGGCAFGADRSLFVELRGISAGGGCAFGADYSQSLLRGAEGDRTPDLVNAIHALSQLSYSPATMDNEQWRTGSDDDPSDYPIRFGNVRKGGRESMPETGALHLPAESLCLRIRMCHHGDTGMNDLGNAFSFPFRDYSWFEVPAGCALHGSDYASRRVFSSLPDTSCGSPRR